MLSIHSFIHPPTHVSTDLYSSSICSTTHPSCPFFSQFIHPSSLIHPATYLSMQIIIHAYIICLCMYHLSIHPLICPSSLIHLAIHPFICASICLSVYALATYLPTYASTGLSIHYHSVHPRIHLSIHSSFHPLIYPPIIHLPMQHRPSIFPSIYLRAMQ